MDLRLIRQHRSTEFPADFVQIKNHMDHEMYKRGPVVAILRDGRNTAAVISWNTYTAENANKSTAVEDGG